MNLRRFDVLSLSRGIELGQHVGDGRYLVFVLAILRLQFIAQFPVIDSRFVGMTDQADSFCEKGEVLHGDGRRQDVLQDRLTLGLACVTRTSGASGRCHRHVGQLIEIGAVGGRKFFPSPENSLACLRIKILDINARTTKRRPSRDCP